MTEAEVIDRINSTIKKNGKNAITGDEMNFVLKAIIQLIADSGGVINWGDIEGTIADQLDLIAALNNKVNVVSGKGLSENDFTDALKTKLDGIEAGAEVNVKADWDATSGDAEILNKPDIPSIAGLVPETRTVNGQALSSNVTLTASDVGAPSGSGTSTDINTGDETKASINSKLELQELAVTGNQSTTSTTAVTVNDLVTGTLSAGKYAVFGSIGASSTTSAGLRIGFNLPSGSSLLIKAYDSGATTTEVYQNPNTIGSVSMIPRNGRGILTIDGTITIGATSGAMQVIFAKTTSGTATILDEGTFLTVKKIA
jgi:hypothetical protein